MSVHAGLSSGCDLESENSAQFMSSRSLTMNDDLMGLDFTPAPLTPLSSGGVGWVSAGDGGMKPLKLASGDPKGEAAATKILALPADGAR